jgi:hypothetical protein
LAFLRETPCRAVDNLTKAGARRIALAGALPSPSGPGNDRELAVTLPDLIPDDDGLVRRCTTDVFSGAISDGVTRPREAFYIDLGIDQKSIPRVSFADVLSKRFDATSVEGKAVIIGVTAPELVRRDRRADRSRSSTRRRARARPRVLEPREDSVPHGLRRELGRDAFLGSLVRGDDPRGFGPVDGLLRSSWGSRDASFSP